VSAGAYDNPRARVVIGDGIEYMRNNPGGFDLVIIDSTDPVGPALGLFQESFYRDVASALAPNGLLVAQSSSPLLMAKELQAQLANLRAVFPIVRTYLGMATGYPGGVWSYTIGSKQYDPCLVSAESIEKRLAAERISPRYYSPEVHQAAFVLPRFIADIVS
jgi:spermidine synthase